MTGEPVSSAGLILLASSTISTVGGLYFSSQQEKIDKAVNNAETERARLVGAETALTSARDFRTALSSQLAISSLRGGASGSLAAQFGSQSVANFMADQRTLASNQKFIGIKSDLRGAEIQSQRFARDVNSVSSLIKAGSESLNMSGPKAKGTNING